MKVPDQIKRMSNSDFETNKRRLKTVIGWHVTAPKWVYGKIPLDYRGDL